MANTQTQNMPQPGLETTGSKDILTAAKGGGITFAGKLFEYAMRFIFGVLIARVVGVEQYGLYTLAITVSLVASNMAMLGLQTGMVRFLPPAIRENDDIAIWSIIKVCVGLPALISILLAAVLFLLAGPMAALLFHDPRMVPLLQIVSVLVPLDTLASMAYVVTISYKQPKFSVISNNVISPVVKLLLAAGFLAVGFSTRGVIAAQAIATAAALAVLLHYINSLFPLTRPSGFVKSYIGQLIRYSFPVHLGWMVNILSTFFSTLLLGFLGLPAGVGVYTAASRFSMIGSMFYLSIGNISTPIIADMHSQRQTALLKAYYQTTTRWLVMFNLPVFLTAVIFARPLLAIFGDDFTTGATSMIILAFGTLAYTGTGVGANILDMTDHPRINTANSIVMVFVTIALNIWLVPLGGVVGAALASAISTVLVNVVRLIEVWVLLGMQPYNRSLIKPISAGLAAALAGLMFTRYFNFSLLTQLLLGGIVLWGVYAFTLYLLKIAPEDRAVIDRLLSRLPLKRHAVPTAVQ